MTDYNCPAEGCDYTAEETSSVKGHINGMSDPSHGDKEALRAAVEEQTDEETTETEGQQADDDHPNDPAQGGGEGGGSGGSSDDDPEQASQGAENPEEGDTDHPDDPDMPTDDEYDRFTSGTTTEQTTPSDASSGGISTDDDSAELPGLPVDTWTLAMLAGLVLLLGLAWFWLRSGTDDSAEQIEIEDDSDDPDETTLID